jgi:hypothetical protein
MSGRVITVIIGAVVVVIAAGIIGIRWVRPDGDVNPRRLLTVSIVAGVLLAAAAVAGAIGGSPWFIMYGVIGIPLLAWITYRQIAHSDS